MMNLLNNMSLIPKNFIVANIVDTLKEDPETGAEKVFEMGDKFVKDPETIALLQQVKDTYYTQPAIRMYAKNLIYNTDKKCLNHFIQNIVVKALIEGISKREQLSQKYRIKVPHAFVLNLGREQLNEVELLVGQARDLGIHAIILTNDDEQFFKIYEKYSDVQFLVLTTSTALTMERCLALTRVSNVVPMIIFDGKAGQVGPSLGYLKASGLLYGIVTPTNQHNWREVTADPYILPLIRQGSRLNWYVTSATDQFNPQELVLLKQQLESIRKMRPYIPLHLEVDTPISHSMISGTFTLTEQVNQKMYQISFPEVNFENSRGKNLIQIFKAHI